MSTVARAECTWCGELGSVSKASVLLLVGMRQLLEAAISNIWGRWRTLSWVCSYGRSILQSFEDPLATGLQSRTVILPLGIVVEFFQKHHVMVR